MHKAPARVLVPLLLLLLLGTAATGSSDASRQGDSQDAHQLRKLLQSELTASCACHVSVHIAFLASRVGLAHDAYRMHFYIAYRMHIYIASGVLMTRRLAFTSASTRP